MDVRPGGAWRRRMRAPDGTVVTKHGVYREIAAPGAAGLHLHRPKAAGIVDPETLVTVTFADLGGRTRLTLRHTAFESDAARLDHQGGWTSCLERFATSSLPTEEADEQRRAVEDAVWRACTTRWPATSRAATCPAWWRW